MVLLSLEITKGPPPRAVAPTTLEPTNEDVWRESYAGHSTMVARGVVCSVALRHIGLSGEPILPETICQGCTFPKPCSGKVVSSRNPSLGRLYLPDILLWKSCTFPKRFRGGCTFPKPKSGANHPSCYHRRISGLLLSSHAHGPQKPPPSSTYLQ